MTETAPEKKSNKKLIAIVIVVLIVCIVLPLCMICVLSMLGPAIGNIFSSVTSGLNP
jgi:flagellar basal body-associated protein FliL